MSFYMFGLGSMDRLICEPDDPSCSEFFSRRLGNLVLGQISSGPQIPVFGLETVYGCSRGIKLDRVNENVNLSKLQKA